MKELKQIFDKVKNGDALGFLADGLAQYPIPLIAGGDCTHCGKVWNVERSENKVSFNFSEQTFSGGKFDKVTIHKQNGLYYAENYHRLNDSQVIYHATLKKKLTAEQEKIGLEDAINQVGKKYGWLSLLFGMKFIDKILPEKLRFKLSAFIKHIAKVCSNHVAMQDSKMGLIEFTDSFYSPMEAITTPAYKKLIVIK